jgi:hypothetical protein
VGKLSFEVRYQRPPATPRDVIGHLHKHNTSLAATHHRVGQFPPEMDWHSGHLLCVESAPSGKHPMHFRPRNARLSTESYSVSQLVLYLHTLHTSPLQAAHAIDTAPYKSSPSVYPIPLLQTFFPIPLLQAFFSIFPEPHLKPTRLSSR